MIYESLTLIGGIGLAAQALLGFAHVGGVHTGHHLSGGNLHGHAHVHLHFGGGSGHSGEGHTAHAQASTSLGRQTAVDTLWALVSPLTLFSLALGAGVSGLAATPHIRNSTLVAVLAVLGALAFYGLIVRPVWRLIFAFASKPAETLSGAVAREAEAVSRFDGHGRGIVTVAVDGQIVRLLARLDKDTKERGGAIAPGDRLLVTGVDERRSTCTVTTL